MPGKKYVIHTNSAQKILHRARYFTYQSLSWDDSNLEICFVKVKIEIKHMIKKPHGVVKSFKLSITLIHQNGGI